MLWAAGGDRAQEITNAFSGADSTSRNAINTGAGTSTEAIVLLASLPWLQCFKQRVAAAWSIMRAQSSGDASVPALETRPPRGSSITEHACAARAPWRNKSPNRVTIETMREVRRMAPLEHIGASFGSHRLAFH